MLLSQPSIRPASGAGVLLAGSYIEAPELVGCSYDTYQRFSGLFLSRTGSVGAYEFIAQRVLGGTA